jgi:DNA primase
VRALLAAARPLTAHLFGAVLPEGREASFEAKMAALARLKSVAGHLPVGLARTAFFEALGAHFGLPAAQLDAELGGARETPAPPAPAAAEAPRAPATAETSAPVHAERVPDTLEAIVLAAVLKAPGLRAQDTFGALAQLTDAGLRAAHSAAGSSSSAAVQRALATATRQLPEDVGALEAVFRTACRKLTLRRVDASLAALARATREPEPGAASHALLAQRAELLSLRKRVLEEPATSTPVLRMPS